VFERAYDGEEGWDWDGWGRESVVSGLECT